MSDNNFRDQVIRAYLNNSITEYALQQINSLSESYSGHPLLGTLALSQLQKEKTENNTQKASCEKNKSSLSAYPKVSFIVPTHNRVQLLPKCLDSILSQNYPNIEIIVIDDCSNDTTEDCMKTRYASKANIIYVRNEQNLGPGGNRQKAYQLLSGDFVVFTDDDDFYFEPTFVDAAIKIFMEYENVGMVCANSIIYNVVAKQLSFHSLTYLGELTGKDFFLGFRTKYRKPNSTFPTVFRKSVLDNAGFKDMWMMNDTSIYLRAACFGDVYMMNQWVGTYLVHDSNISKALPHKFILENLDEKAAIYSIAQSQFGTDLDDWYYSQLVDTIIYYLKSDRISFFNFCSLLKWCASNGKGQKKQLIKAVIAAKKSCK